MEMLKDVLVKEVNSRGDLVFIVEELPKEFFYIQVPAVKLSNFGDTVTPIEGKFTDKLIEGITHSQTGDQGFLFDPSNNNSKPLLERVDRYIQDRLPVNSIKPQRVRYAERPGDMASPAKPLSKILRVTFDAPPATQVVAQTVALSDSETKALEERMLAKLIPIAEAAAEKKLKAKQADAAKVRMAKVRAAKMAKKTN